MDEYSGGVTCALGAFLTYMIWEDLALILDSFCSALAKRPHVTKRQPLFAGMPAILCAKLPDVVYTPT